MTKGAILILGATSSIARCVAMHFAEEGYPIYLTSRDEKDLERLENDLKIRYQIDVAHGCLDVEAFDTHESFFKDVVKRMKGLEGVISFTGYLGNHLEAIRNFREAKKIIDCNYTGVCSLLTYSANYLEQQKKGFIIGITSAAGVRGKQSNYVYGSAKGGLEIFLSGLRNRLFHCGVHVMTVIPGFVDTAMTFNVKSSPFNSAPETVSRDIFKAWKKKKNVIYTPWIWSHILRIIRHIPESIFKRLKL